MGSSFTRDRGRMRAAMDVIADTELYYLDSMTSAQSTGFEEAERAGVPAARNTMFLDSQLDQRGTVDPDPRLREVLEIAWSRVRAIAIGHPRPETLAELRRALPVFRESGVELVFVSELTR